MRYIIYILALTTFLIGCSKDQPLESLAQINIKVDPDNFKVLKADSIFSGVRYVPLQTSEEILITTIDKLQIYNEKFYILDRRQKTLSVFDKEGGFLSRVSQVGEGPQEYISLDDFTLHNGRLYLLSSDSRALLCFDADSFRFIQSYPLASYGSNICFSDDWFYYFTNFSDKDLFNILQINLENAELKGFQPFLNKQRGVRYQCSPFSVQNDSLFYVIPYDFTIYCIHENECFPYRSVSLDQENSLPKAYASFSDEERVNYRIQNYGDRFSGPIAKIDNLFVGAQFIYFTFLAPPGLLSSVFVAKDSSKMKWGALSSYSKTTAYPLASNNPCYVDDSLVVCAISQEVDMKEVFRNRNREIPLALQNVSPDDNPVLCIYSLKQGFLTKE